MKRKLLFNHIPKTGGTSFRIILNRVYGSDQVFFIQSKNIGNSLEEFKNLDPRQRKKYRVISGHGAELFSGLIENPFRISVLREPVSLFISQYHYLKKSTNSNFLNEVSALKSEADYLDYAIANGQDNLLTRYFSNSMQWLVNPAISIPEMEKQGDQLLDQAKSNLHQYDALIELSRFDQGVYALSKRLNWPKIPVYRPSNITKMDKNAAPLTHAFHQRLEHVLRWDIALYEYFTSNNLDISGSETPKELDFLLFKYRQKGIQMLSKLLGKK